MNFLGHAHAALATGRHEPLYVLGSTLPDLAGMARIRVPRDRLPDALAAGVRCHIAADAAFHAHPAFRQGAAALRRDLAAVGLGSGPSRAVGHIGWELLLDGTLVGSAVEAAYWESLGQGEELVPYLRDDDRSRWRAFLAHRDRRPRLRYDDPLWVAERVHIALDGRPRLRFPKDRVPEVAAALGGHRAAVAGSADAVLDQVVASLGPACGAT